MKRLPDSMAFGEERRGGGFGGPREMHPAKCSTCGKDIQVPFKPTEGRPVYCQEHYTPRGGGGGRRF